MANAVFLQRTCIKTSLDQLPSTKSLPGWRVRVDNRVPTQRQRVQSIIASGHGQKRSKGVTTRASPIEPTWSDASVLREESSETLKPDVGGWFYIKICNVMTSSTRSCSFIFLT